MTHTQIERAIERVFGERWDYSGSDPGYFREKAQNVRAFARGLQDLADRSARIEQPANLQNFYRVEVCLSPGIEESRYTLDLEQVRALGEVIYLEILCSVILPVSEASWRRFTTPERLLVQDVHDLLSEEWLTAHPDHEELACGVLELGQANHLEVVANEILGRRASPELPVPFPGNDPAALRDFVFPGVLD